MLVPSIPSPVHALDWLASVTDTSTLLALLGSGTGGPGRLCPADFDVDPKTGFFPRQPLPRLPEQYQLWETALAGASGAVKLGDDCSDGALAMRAEGESWRSSIRTWPVISVSALNGDLRLLQRAHMVLASVMHFYVHSLPPADAPIIVPKALAIPLVEVSRQLRMAPVLTFADTVLWNWELVDPERPLSLDNMRYLNIFSGSDDERNFYLASAAVELKGVEMLEIFERFANSNCSTRSANDSDTYASATLSRDLTRLARIVNELTEIFKSIRETVDPDMFYWTVRPWWSGSTSKGPSHPGWVLEGVPDSHKLDLGGASAGQSSVMHALDIFLDVDHKLQRSSRTPGPSPDNKRADRGFMERMRRYMPGLHREYLAHVRPVREVVERLPTLREPYNAAIAALKKLRDVHIRIVAIYIVTRANGRSPFGPEHGAEGMSRADKRGPARGTGGSEVSNLLKAGRDATQRTLLGD
ncbi:Indoleamine 2,3-dioxygenase [Laetiporus sulphureus 93-53]|uniref:Indoleamine 2,3-dioxygenase n=1 Tax=Laetiporus sulphureus 93-53 TaxID=1314785 RepID=A0A165C6Y3_9APHY|nr:Indoleamine 2,3-dioxygenase [Laetiporus sulphureus 93-53]KZT02306.1 Indoleamine 2,3-dioxygenase [Laetiporus sulphureus 93-53]